MKDPTPSLRECREILNLCLTMSNKEVAERLLISEKTVTNVLRTCGSLRNKKKLIIPSFINEVKRLLPYHTNSEIASILSVSVATVRRSMFQYGLVRTQEQESAIKSRVRKKLLMAERRRVLFGREQLTRIKVFSNKERNVLRNNLRRKRYIVLPNNQTIYFDGDTRRNETFEERGKRLGLTFRPLPTLSNS